jgi:hypothetical protein
MCGLPADFFDGTEQDQIELDAALGIAPATDTNVSVDAPATAVAPTAFDRDQAINRRIAAERHLAEARAAVRITQDRLRDAKGALQTAVAAYQAGGAKHVTQDTLKRDFLRSEQEHRLAVAAGKAPPRQRAAHGRSQVDVTAAYSAGGSGADFVRKGFGRGRGYHRGAFPGSMRGRPDPYAPPKLPSDR